MKIVVKNRKQVEEFNEIRVPHIIISIYGSDEDQPKVVQNEKTLRVLFLQFDDIDKCSNGKCPISNEMAQQVVTLIKSVESEAIVCHCRAGQSRSAGMAAALSLYLNHNDSEFFSQSRGMYGSPRFTPNMLVYRTVLNALHGNRK